MEVDVSVCCFGLEVGSVGSDAQSGLVGRRSEESTEDRRSALTGERVVVRRKACCAAKGVASEESHLDVGVCEED